MSTYGQANYAPSTTWSEQCNHFILVRWPLKQQVVAPQFNNTLAGAILQIAPDQFKIMEKYIGAVCKTAPSENSGARMRNQLDVRPKSEIANLILL